MRVALLYPPPWKIAPAGSSDDYGQEGAPREYVAGDLDGDFFQTPYGLLCLGAEALRAGHSVKVINLSSFDWPTVEKVIARLDADLFGLSCWTANRRGAGSVAREIRRYHPSAHIVVGGPHATALPLEMLAHHPAIDTIAVGESERTLLDLAARVARKEPCVGVEGTAYRSDGQPVFAPPRAPIRDLDSLASPHDVFDTHVIMTSRGCPWRCTFCGAEASWGRGYRSHSTAYVLDALERMASRLPLRMVQIKDDTFTTDRKRVIAICHAIRDRGIRLRWSCDTRVDVLDDEVLKEMRLAGCERLSFGVESGSQRILDAIDKKITLAQIERSTELARKWGMVVRYYMMLGNRGETRESFEESLRFLERARPHQYIFGCLAVYPGTRDYREATRQGWLRAASYFDGDFQELKTTFDASEADTSLMADWFQKNKGLKVAHRPDVPEARGGPGAATGPRRRARGSRRSAVRPRTPRRGARSLRARPGARLSDARRRPQLPGGRGGHARGRRGDEAGAARRLPEGPAPSVRHGQPGDRARLAGARGVRASAGPGGRARVPGVREDASADPARAARGRGAAMVR